MALRDQMHYCSNYQGRYRSAGCQVTAHGSIGDFKLAGDLGLAESRPVDEFAKFTWFHLANLGQIVLGHNFLVGIRHQRKLIAAATNDADYLTGLCWSEL